MLVSTTTFSSTKSFLILARYGKRELGGRGWTTTPANARRAYALRTWKQLNASKRPHVDFVWLAIPRFRTNAGLIDDLREKWNSLRSGNILAELVQVPKRDAL